MPREPACEQSSQSLGQLLLVCKRYACTQSMNLYAGIGRYRGSGQRRSEAGRQRSAISRQKLTYRHLPAVRPRRCCRVFPPPGAERGWILELRKCRPRPVPQALGASRHVAQRAYGLAPQGRTSCHSKQPHVPPQKRNKLSHHTRWMTHRASCYESRFERIRLSSPRRWSRG